MSDASTHKNLASALAAFQADLPQVIKGNTARVTTKTGGSYSYDYADLTDVSAAVLPKLAAQGLAWITALGTDGNVITLTWMLQHGESGESLSGVVPVGVSGQNWQDLGGSITYARRYCLVSATGVAPGGDDNDGENARAGEHQAPRQTPQPPIAQETGELPADLYRLSSLTTLDDVKAMWFKARDAGHLNLTIPVPDGEGNLVDTPFAVVLTQVADRIKAQDAAKIEAQDQADANEAAEAAAIAAHEAEEERGA